MFFSTELVIINKANKPKRKKPKEKKIVFKIVVN